MHSDHSYIITGQTILDCKILKGAADSQLKNSTYDLRIGKIIPHGENKENKSIEHDGEVFYIQPAQAVSIVSKEEFSLPWTITGIATLRTTFTKKGLLALNVGIIDPGYNGPVSTTLLNFSSVRVQIRIDESFFRVYFIAHNSVEKWKPESSESRSRKTYENEIADAATLNFSESFLNVQEFNKDWHFNFLKKILQSFWVLKIRSIGFLLFFLILFAPQIVWFSNNVKISGVPSYISEYLHLITAQIFKEDKAFVCTISEKQQIDKYQCPK